MTKIISRLAIFIFISGIVSGVSSCKDPDIIGLDVQPPGDKINLTYSDTTTITAYTIREDSLRTDETSLQLLGSYMDSVFGRTDASIYAQAVLSSAGVNFDSLPVADSLVLSLAYKGYYGDTTQQTFHVYRVIDDMSYDSAYYSNKTFQYEPVELGSATVIPAPNDSVLIYGVKTAPHLRINISSFGDSLVAHSGQSQLANNTNFLAYFKGIYIKADNAMNDGAILYFNLFASQSKMTLYYHNAINDSLHYDFIFSSTSARMTNFNHDYTTTPVAAQLSDSANGTNLVYVQSMAGVKTKIRFPHIMDYINDGMIAINKAEVEITVSDSSTAHWAVPPKLLLLGVDSVGTPVFLPDQFEGAFYYGGDYNSTERKYKFNVARYIQNILLGKTKDYGLYLAVSGGSVQANRAIICGATHSSSRMKLNLYYTRPN
ncbi:MAG: DUF4270 domain-containing protein [Bacteroidia bacterium]|nr:DUF4270 domain-containing protein [Bacteroidia bacterium]